MVIGFHRLLLCHLRPFPGTQARDGSGARGFNGMDTETIIK